MEANEAKNKDARLWTEAKKRVGFRSHLISYILVNALLWIVWWQSVPEGSMAGHIPWPVWPTIGWGIGLIFHYVFTYLVHSEGRNAIEREYRKLVRDRNRRTHEI